MDEHGEYDGTVYEIPYRRAQRMVDAELETIIQTARVRLKSNYEAKGDGWQKEEPRYHMWKAMDEQFSATHYVYNGRLTLFDKRMADAFNHIGMASYLAHDDVAADGGGEVFPLSLYEGHDDRWPAPGRLLHRVAGGTDDRYATSEPGDVGQVRLERGGSEFLITVENVTEPPESD